MNRAQALAVAALLATGCIPDTNGLDPLRSAASVCPVLFDLLTAKLAECEGFAPSLADATYASASGSCASIAAAEQAGRIGYDRALAQACVDQLAAPGCAQLENACNDPPFLPRVGVGGVCGTELECTSASAGCYSPSLTCPSHCLAPGGAGASCSGIDPPCGSTLYCDSTSLTCKARVDFGASCSSVPCLPGLYCDLSLSICQTQLPQGSPCGGYGQCSDAQGLFCDMNVTSPICKALPTTGSAAGGRCDYPYSCNFDAWCDYSTTPSTCKAKVPVPQACTSDNGCSTPASACIQDSAGSTLRHCKVLLTEGTTCTPGLSQCQRGLFCAQPPSGAATCASWPAVGGTCGTINGEDVPCSGTSWCQLGAPPATTGTCKAPVAPGQPCPTYRECGEGNFGFTATRCENVPGQGLICVASCPAP